MANARIEKQIGVVAPDRMGLLSEVTEVLAEAGVNIVAISAWSMEGNANFLMVTSDSGKARAALEGREYVVKENEVVLIDLENVPGAATRMTRKLAEAGIDMSYLYGTAGAEGEAALMVLESDNNAKAVEVLSA